MPIKAAIADQKKVVNGRLFSVHVLLCVYLMLSGWHDCLSVFSRVLRDSKPRFVGPSVRHTLLFRHLWFFWLYRSCPNAPLTSNMALAHPQATGVAVYPALFQCFLIVSGLVWYASAWVYTDIAKKKFTPVKLRTWNSFSRGEKNTFLTINFNNLNKWHWKNHCNISW